jgi:cephalosporin-C deacetylase-like acetyl esterase
MASIGGGRIKRLSSDYPFLERFDRAAAAGFEAPRLSSSIQPFSKTHSNPTAGP